MAGGTGLANLVVQFASRAIIYRTSITASGRGVLICPCAVVEVAKSERRFRYIFLENSSGIGRHHSKRRKNFLFVESGANIRSTDTATGGSCTSSQPGFSVFVKKTRKSSVICVDKLLHNLG